MELTSGVQWYDKVKEGGQVGKQRNQGTSFEDYNWISSTIPEYNIPKIIGYTVWFNIYGNFMGVQTYYQNQGPLGGYAENPDLKHTTDSKDRWGRSTILFADDEYLTNLYVYKDIFGSITFVKFVTNKRVYSNDMSPVGNPVGIAPESTSDDDINVIVSLGGQFNPNSYFNHIYAHYVNLADFEQAQVDNYKASDPYVGYQSKFTKPWSCLARDWIMRDEMNNFGTEHECAKTRTDDRKTWWRHVEEADIGYSGDMYYYGGTVDNLLRRINWYDIPDVRQITWTTNAQMLFGMNVLSRGSVSGSTNTQYISHKDDMSLDSTTTTELTDDEYITAVTVTGNDQGVSNIVITTNTGNTYSSPTTAYGTQNQVTETYTLTENQRVIGFGAWITRDGREFSMLDGTDDFLAKNAVNNIVGLKIFLTDLSKYPSSQTDSLLLSADTSASADSTDSTELLSSGVFIN